MDKFYTIMITGVCGFIGSNLAKRLIKEGHTVVGIDNLSVGFEENISSLKDNPRFMFLNIDIRNINVIGRYLDIIKIREFIEEQGGDIEIVYHLAARGETYWCQQNPTEAIDVNISGTVNMLEIAKEFGCKHFVFADTSAEYDNIEYKPERAISNYPESRTVSIEQSTYPSRVYQAPNDKTPRGLYSITKMAASQFVRAWSDENAIGSTLFRPFNVYGQSMNLDRDIPPVIGAFIKAFIDKKQPVIFGDGSKRRDFIYIEDVVELLTRVLQFRIHMIDTQTFNMGTGINHSILEIYNYIKSDLSRRYNEMPIEFMSPKHLQNKEYEAQITLADMTETNNYFNWNPSTKIEEGISKTLDSIL
jgi:UDP-glucose 4-epimerase